MKGLPGVSGVISDVTSTWSPILAENSEQNEQEYQHISTERRKTSVLIHNALGLVEHINYTSFSHVL